MTETTNRVEHAALYGNSKGVDEMIRSYKYAPPHEQDLLIRLKRALCYKYGQFRVSKILIGTLIRANLTVLVFGTFMYP